MNNETDSAALSNYIEMVYEQTVQQQVFCACLALLIYASLLHFGDEVQYIWKWKKKLSLPNILYVLTQYPLLAYQIILLVQAFVEITSIDVCNDLGFVGGALAIFAYIGIQGQISYRAYIFYRGYRPMAIALFIAFMVPLILQIYGVTILECSTQTAGNTAALFLARNITVLVSEALAFIAIIWHIWGTLKLKRELKRELKQEMPTSLANGCTADIARQGILRFFFVLCITTVQVFLSMFQLGLVGGGFTSFQNVLSAILMCQLTTDLRRRHGPKEASDESESPSLPPLSYRPGPGQSVQFSQQDIIQENMVAEFGERNGEKR